MTVTKYDIAKWCTYKVSDSIHSYARILDVKGSKVTIIGDESNCCFDILNKYVVFVSNLRYNALRTSLQLNGEFHDS